MLAGFMLGVKAEVAAVGRAQEGSSPPGLQSRENPPKQKGKLCVGEGGGHEALGRTQPCEDREVPHDGFRHLHSPLGRSPLAWGAEVRWRKAARSVGNQQDPRSVGDTASQQEAQDVPDEEDQR